MNAIDTDVTYLSMTTFATQEKKHRKKSGMMGKLIEIGPSSVSDPGPGGKK